MKDLRQSFPAADQYNLLAAHGFGEVFGGLWLEREDLGEIAGLLQLDRHFLRETSLAQMEKRVPEIIPFGGGDAVWIGPHCPGWSVVVSLGALNRGGPLLCEGERRMLEVSWLWEIDGVYPMYYRYNGKQISDELEGWRVPSGAVFEPYTDGLFADGDDDQGDEVTANAYLTIVGRMSGRFIDEEWFHTTGRVYQLSLSSDDGSNSAG